jgi:putative transcriptional regulator
MYLIELINRYVFKRVYGGGTKKMIDRNALNKMIAGLCLLAFLSLYGQIKWDVADASPAIPRLNNQLASLSRGMFLVADPKVLDPAFEKTVLLLLQNGTNGSIGLVINRSTNVPLSKLLPRVDMNRPFVDHLYDGGPVGRKTLTLLYRTEETPKGVVPLFSNVYSSQEARVLAEQLRISEQKYNFRLYAGYASWGVGQLRREIERGDWYLVKADTTTLYKRPVKQIWQEMYHRSQELRI